MQQLIQTINTKFPESNTRINQDWLEVELPSSQWQPCGLLLKETGFNYLASLTAVHWVDQELMEVAAHLFAVQPEAYPTPKAVMKTRIPHQPGTTLDTLTGVWPTTNWHERELYDMFGIEINGHPDLRRILMREGYQGFPLRKDFIDQKPSMGVSRGTLIKDDD